MMLLTEEQAAARLQMKPSTLRAWRSRPRLQGRGPAYIQPGPHRPVRYKVEDLESWIERNRHSFNGD